MKNVLIITYYWPPSGGPGVQRWLKFVKYLPSFGICPFVLTVKPEQAEYPIIDESLTADIAPDLHLTRTDCKGFYSWYKRLTGARTAPYSGFANEAKPSFLQKAARFLRGNLFLPDARRGWGRYAFKEACRIVEQHDIKAFVTTGPPHSVHLIGLKLKQKYNITWIADFRDPWSNIQYKSFLYQTRWAMNKELSYERQVLCACDTLTVAVDERTRLASIHPVPLNKMVFIPNGYDEADFAGRTAVSPARLTITYTGTVAENYPLEGLLRALSSLDVQTDFLLRFVGQTDAKTQEQCRTWIGDRVEFVPFVPHAQSIDYLMSSSVLLLVNAQVEGSRFLLHGKLFEYMASGKPILLLGDPAGTSAQILSEARAGQAFDYHDAVGISSFLTEGYRHIKAEADYVARFSRRNITQRVAELMK